MSPRNRRRRRLRPMAFVAVLAAAALLAGCGATPFDPSSPCTADARVAGAYPDLEALVPREFRATPASRVDSGRTCTDAGLGSLVRHEVKELRFAGATWDLGAAAGVTIAILDAPGLQTGWVEEFYESGARAAKNTETVETGTKDLPNGTTAYRLDTLNGESFQTVIVWPDRDRVKVALIASFVRAAQTREVHEAVVDDALAAAFPGSAVATPLTAPSSP